MAPPSSPVSRFKIQDSRFKVQDSRFKIQDSRFKIQGSRFKIQDSRFKIQNHSVQDSDHLCLYELIADEFFVQLPQLPRTPQEILSL